MPSTTKFFSPNDIAHRLGVPVHRVSWVIRSRNITATHRVGGRAIYDFAVVERVRLGLQETSDRWNPVVTASH